MVVGTALPALYVLFALDAERPVLAGAMLACAFMSRPTMLLAAPLFALEAVRVSCVRVPTAVEWLTRRADSRGLARLDKLSARKELRGVRAPDPGRVRGQLAARTMRATVTGAPSIPATST